MATQPNAYPLRLDPTLSAKIKALTKINERSFKGQIENILKKICGRIRSQTRSY